MNVMLPWRLDKSPLLACLPLLGALAGCPGGQGAAAPSRPLPSYVGRATELFDDNIEPAAVGLDFDKSYTPRGDPLLRERAQVADAVLRVKVSTVTSRAEDNGAVYQIGLATTEKLAGSFPPPDSFIVHVGKTSPSAGIMKNFEARLVGRDFVGFVRLFVRADGDHELHFHLGPDTKEMKVAIANAVVLEAVETK